MELSLVRIDDRLIHGQVATDWAKYSKCNRIIVSSDQVAEDTLRKSLLLSIVPPGLKANIITIDKTIEAYHNPKNNGVKALMLLTCPKDAVRLFDGGVDINSINVGGMSYKTGKKQITAAVSVDQEDVNSFMKLNERKVALEIRMLSSDHAIDLVEKLREQNII